MTLSRTLGPWTLVVLAAGLEVAWALLLAEADGLARPGWAAAGIVVALLSLLVLTVALRALPLGSAYAVWVGAGAAGVAIAGVALRGEPLTLPRASPWPASSSSATRHRRPGCSASPR